MDSNKIEKEENSIDLKSMIIYLLTKWWLVLAVTVVFVLGALLYTKFFVTPVYSSTSEIFIINKTGENDLTTGDWSIGIRLAKTAPIIFKLDFCEEVADRLNSDPKFVEKYKDVLPDGKISANDIYRNTSVTSDEDTLAVTFTTVNTNNELAADIVNAITQNFTEYTKRIIGSDSITTEINQRGRVAKNPYNVRPVKNMALSGAVAFIIVCIALVIVFIFNDKIRTPDDIERQLKLSVLGTIPNFETKSKE